MSKLFLTALLCSLPGYALAQTNYSKPVKMAAVMCFSAGEQISGLNKICYYNCAGSQAAITVSNVSLCPMSIQR